ncbi:MAG: winged helix-turn-helix domain-containing protein [Chloroflexi bacterium]|nr:winged helix-turn-helix domain-containing protein [Chloroflexota bacterium]
MTPALLTAPGPRTDPAANHERPDHDRAFGALLYSLRSRLGGLQTGRFGPLTAAQQRALQELEDACAAALLTMSDRPAPTVLEHGALRMDRIRRIVTVHSEELRLTRTEFDLLWRLLSRAGRTVSYEELTHQVWGIPDGGSALIKQHLSRLKSKVERALGRPWPVRNVRSIGYLWNSGISP